MPGVEDDDDARGDQGDREDVPGAAARLESGSGGTSPGARIEHGHFRDHEREPPRRQADRELRGRPRRGRPRPAALLGRARHQRDAEVDPGLLRGRGRLPHRQPRPARRGLRRDRGQGAAARRARVPRRRCPRAVLHRLRGPGDQGQRPLRRRLPALHGARPAADRPARRRVRPRAGCDTIAHGCTGKGNDQVRIEATVATLAPELRTIAPVRSWQMGREEEIAYAREHGIPVKGGTEVTPTRSTTTSGAAPRRAAGSRTSTTLPRTTSSSSSPGPRRRRTSRRRSRSSSRPASRSPSTASASAGRAARSRRRDRRPPRGRDRRPHRGPDRRPQGARHLRGAGGGDPAHRAPGAGEAGRRRSTRTSSRPSLDRKWAYLVYAGLWWEPLRSDLDAFMEAANVQVTGTIGLQALQRQRPGRHPLLAERRLRRRPRLLRRVGRALLAVRLARLHRALVAAVAPRAPDPAARGGGVAMYNRLGRAAIRFSLDLPAPPLPPADPDRTGPGGHRRGRCGRRVYRGAQGRPRGLIAPARSLQLMVNL